MEGSKCEYTLPFFSSRSWFWLFQVSPSNALPEYSTATINYRIDFLSSVNETLSRISSILSPIASSLNLTYSAFSTDSDLTAPPNNHVRLSVVEGSKIEPAPLTPTEGEVWELMSGTARHVFNGSIVAPSAMIGESFPTLSRSIKRDLDKKEFCLQLIRIRNGLGTWRRIYIVSYLLLYHSLRTSIPSTRGEFTLSLYCRKRVSRLTKESLLVFRIHVDAHLSSIKFFYKLIKNTEGWEAE